LTRTKFLLSALERSYGLAAASTVPQVPTDDPVDVLAKYEDLDGEARTAFYKANRDTIMAAHMARPPSPRYQETCTTRFGPLQQYYECSINGGLQCGWELCEQSSPLLYCEQENGLSLR
jgi:hypothetical protein